MWFIDSDSGLGVFGVHMMGLVMVNEQKMDGAHSNSVGSSSGCSLFA